MKCNACGGIQVNILSYRDWQERGPDDKPDKYLSMDIDVDNTSNSLNCNKCRRIMLKYKVSMDKENTIDFCNHCAEAWLDQGEWHLLNVLGLKNKLTAIFTDPWQIAMKKNHLEKTNINLFKEKIGINDFNKLDELTNWLDTHKYKIELLQYIQKTISSR